MKRGKDVEEKLQKVRAGGDAKYHEKARERGKLFCRDRIARLLDEGSFVEDAALANSLAGDLPADGVVTGTGRINGRGVCVMANDSTVKAGSWGARTVEKILRIQKQAERLQVPLVYMVDSAGARITDQIQMFPGRRGAGLIFHNQVRMSGMLPQLCLLFGPSAAGGAYIPAFCDVVFMVEGNASMYLGSPRMAEMVIGQTTTLEEMGGAKMHCSVSGCGDLLAKSEPEAIEAARTYLSYLPQSCEGELPVVDPVPPAASCDDLEELIPEQENKLFDVRKVIERIVDADSFFQIKRLFAGEILTGLARIDGRPVGIVANQPKVKGGVLFVDSADKAARFIELCDAYGLPLVFLADVPGFMIGKQVEREGIIRAGAKM
ncbi:MAG: acyl-CoA carboxylase subunit beta, partial [Myxococcales bacterium]|nr:acyl-CoA carboxylase subunit beta [Myxococcales bacterium]